MSPGWRGRSTVSIRYKPPGRTSDVTNRSFTGSSDTAPPGHQSPPPAPGGTPATRTGETPRPETFGRTRFLLHFPKHESHVRPKPSQRPLFKCPPSNLRRVSHKPTTRTQRTSHPTRRTADS